MKHTVAVLLEVLAIGAVPVVLIFCTLIGAQYTAALSFLVVLTSLGLFFAGYERRKPRLRDTMPVAVLAALGAAGRILFAPIPSFKPVSAICIVAGAVFGRRSGFMVGALAALASNFFFGQGAWTPWQMYAWGLVGYLAGLLAQTKVFDKLPVVLAYGFISGYLFGLVMNIWSIVGFFHTSGWADTLLVYAAAIPFDTMHAVATVVFLLILYVPWRRKLVRVKRKYGLCESD